MEAGRDARATRSWPGPGSAGRPPLALGRNGCRVTVLEQVAALGEVGAGIQLSLDITLRTGSAARGCEQGVTRGGTASPTCPCGSSGNRLPACTTAGWTRKRPSRASACEDLPHRRDDRI